MPLISIIVPVYKAENTLAECVESLLSQTLQDLEIILVDDGSPDRCPEMCDHYAEDPRIKVIHKENGGVSSARNAGLDAAEGKYIGFVDSDDWIEPEMYQVLYDAIRRESADLAMCNVVYDDGATSKVMPLSAQLPPIGKAGRTEALRLILFYFGYGCVVYNKLYSRETFNHEPAIRFEPTIFYGEDLLAVTQFVLRIEHATYHSKALYHYRIHAGSASNKVSQTMLTEFEALRRLELLLPVELKGYCPATQANRALHFACRALLSNEIGILSELRAIFDAANASYRTWRSFMGMFPAPYRLRLWLARFSFIGACRIWNLLRKFS